MASRGNSTKSLAGRLGESERPLGRGTFSASTRQERSEGWLGARNHSRGIRLPRPKRPVGSIKRCQNEVSRRKPGDTEATRAVCDFFCDFAGFLILAVRPPLIPWGGIANCGWGGIEPAIRFRKLSSARFGGLQAPSLQNLYAMSPSLFRPLHTFPLV